MFLICMEFKAIIGLVAYCRFLHVNKLVLIVETFMERAAISAVVIRDKTKLRIPP